MRFLLLVLVAVSGFVASGADCPSEAPGLSSFASDFPDPEGGDLVITKPTLLDVSTVNVNTITIKDEGQLVFSQGQTITIVTKGILVQDNGALIIGSESCPHEDNVNIILDGQRTSERASLGPEGEKYIAVTGNGVLQIFGQVKRPWTKLTQTVQRFTHSDYASNVLFRHATSANIDSWAPKNGLMMYTFDGEDLSQTGYHNLLVGRKDAAKEEKKVNQFIEAAFEGIQDGDVVAITTRNNFMSTTPLDSLYEAIEEAAGLDDGTLLLRSYKDFDAFALVFFKGGASHQVLDPMIGKVETRAAATIIRSGKKVSAICSVTYQMAKHSSVDVRILDEQVGFPAISVVQNISSWNVGDQVLLTSTDYTWKHAEVKTILSKDDDFTIRLADELEYRHFGEVEDGVDMRGEVALLSRNIKILGKMTRGCPASNDNCNFYDFDTYGGQIKIFESFGSVHIEGAELINMGQTQDKGNYPIHFHMCGNITGKTAIVKHNSIHDSFARCITVHGTYGTSETDLGVQLIGNVGYNVMGHCFFLEDGAEMATSLIDNLGASTRVADNGFVTDKGKPTTYWITNPKVIMKGNVAAGSEGFGIWYTFPEEPVGPSKVFGVYGFKEASHTPIWEFDNNIVHSNLKGGMFFDNILDDENGTVVGCMQYSPKQDPTNDESADVKVQFTRLTAYKNLRINCWLRGGWFELVQYASADSMKGLQFARGSPQQMFIKKSVFIGKSDRNCEEEGYPDRVSDADLKQYLGVVFHDGPTYIQTTWFKSFKPCDDGSCVAGALGFATKNKFTSSVVSNITDLRFAFEDPSEGNRVFDGIVDQESLGQANFDGDETATFRDADGSVTKCSGDSTWSYPVQVVTPEKYLLTDQCTYRENWALAICKNKYGKFKTRAMARFSGQLDDFDNSGSMKRVNENDIDNTAVEDHADVHSSEFMVLLGDEQYYYQFQFTQEFPKIAIFEARGVERDEDVVVGICLPEGTSRDDISLFYKSPNNVVTGGDSFILVDTLQEVFNDTQMRRVYVEGRFLYVKFSSRKTRDAAWDKHDTDHCPGEFCPRLRIDLKKNQKYTTCFTPTQEELSNTEALRVTPREACSYPATSPDSDWGLLDTFGSQDGQWGEWTGWTDCCVGSANQATSTRYRLCDSPSKLGDGADCVGDSSETQDCPANICPVDGVVGLWTTWSECVCDGIGAGSKGTRLRTRNCVGTSNGGEYCDSSTDQYAGCNGKCVAEGEPVHGTKTQWSAWTDCFCDGIAAGTTGVKTRSRSCEGVANGGKPCTGSLNYVKPCNGDCGYNG